MNKEKCTWKMENKKSMISKNHAFVVGLDPKYLVCRICGHVKKANEAAVLS